MAATAVLAVFVLALTATARGNGGVFRADDPLAREPETQDASGVKAWDIDLFIDLATNLFSQPGDVPAGIRARNVNTIDEVPDSSWFTNRMVATPLSVPELLRGPLAGDGPAPGPWTVVAAKEIGAAPGFTIEDGTGQTWFISFDARGYPEAATGALMAANKIFWALGYWQVENFLLQVTPGDLVIGDTARISTRPGRERRMNREDLAAVWARAQPSADGSYRAVAARRLPGKPLGGFRYYGTRPDDPNDLVPHEHRRELRALQVFGAWTNLVDMKAGNTLDMLVTHPDGHVIVRHYLQDVGSTFGTGANAPREFDEGWEHLYEGSALWKRLVSLGLYIKPWQTTDYAKSPAVGRFEGTEFEPATWRPRVPTAALRHAQPDDLFWAARRVAAFSDEMIHAITTTSGYSDPEAARHLADVLIQRRDKIASTYLNVVSPIVEPHLAESGRLSFMNAAVAAGVAFGPGGGYEVRWHTFDNVSGDLSPIGEPVTVRATEADAPPHLPRSQGSFVCALITPINPPYETWTPVRACFRRGAMNWTLVGLNRSGV